MAKKKTLRPNVAIPENASLKETEKNLLDLDILIGKRLRFETIYKFIRRTILIRTFLKQIQNEIVTEEDSFLRVEDCRYKGAENTDCIIFFKKIENVIEDFFVDDIDQDIDQDIIDLSGEATEVKIREVAVPFKIVTSKEERMTHKITNPSIPTLFYRTQIKSSKLFQKFFDMAIVYTSTGKILHI